MLRRLLLVLVVLSAVLLPLTGPAQAAGPADLRLTVRVVQGAVIDNNASRLPLSITWSAPACPHGCQLFFTSCTDSSHDRVLDRVAAGGSAAARAVSLLLPVNQGRHVPGCDGDTLWVLRYLDAGHVGLEALKSWVGARVVDENHLTYSGQWPRDVSNQATETMIRRSSASGARATTSLWSPTGAFAQIGLISARGPQSGVMSVNGRLIDLTAPRYTPGRVVHTEQFVASGVTDYRLSVLNATPAGRAQSEVHVDGWFTLNLRESRFTDATGTSGPRPGVGAPPPIDPVGERLEASAFPNKQITVGKTMSLVVTAWVFGCPDGCRIVREAAGTEPLTVAVRTSPSTTTLQTFAGPVLLPPDPDVPSLSLRYDFVLYKGTTRVAVATDRGTQIRTGFDAISEGYSHSWARVADDQALDGSLMRTLARGAGATMRVHGRYEGRELGIVGPKGAGAGYGVFKVYVNGKLVTTIDQAADAVLRPRVVLVGVRVPLDGRLTIVNATPADRSSSAVVVDGIVEILHGQDR